LRLVGWIDADGDDFYAPRLEFLDVLLEAPQLGVAERSPIAAIENQQDGAMALQ
jgi:hypothetical protein